MILKKLTPEDVTDVSVSWLNDPEVNRYLQCRYHVHTVQSERKSVGSDSNYFGIFAPDYIGNINYVPHHWQPTASIGLVIGDRKFWGRGLGTEAVRLMSEKLFKEGFKKLWATIFTANHSSLRVFQKAGYAVEGKFINHYILDGRMADLHIVGRYAP